MYHPAFRKLAKSQIYERKATNKSPKGSYVQSNRLLRQGRYFYPYAVGIKTGYHSKAQHTLVSAAEKDDRLLICVLMRCKDRSQIWQDARNLFDAAFNETKVEKMLLASGDQSFVKAFDDATVDLATYTKEPLKLGFYPSEEPEFRCLLVWDELELPIKRDTRVGEIQLKAGDEVLASVALYAKDEIQPKWHAKLCRKMGEHWMLTIVVFGIFIIGGFVLLRRRR
jgi:D-alanyl-D-alanine carboxypeptidase (penicillin-binding protein 5/6)